MLNTEKVPREITSFCLSEDPYRSHKDSDNDFMQAFRVCVELHREKSEFYANFLLKTGWSKERVKALESCLDFPFLPAEFFKRNNISSLHPTEVFLHLTSSGTSGQKSQIFFDEWTLGSAQKMLDSIFLFYNWVSTEPTNYLLYSYETSPHSNLGTSYTDHYLCKYAPAKRVEVALKRTNSGKHEFDLFGCVRALREFAKEGLPVRIFGFPAFFHFSLQQIAFEGAFAPKLNPNSLVFLGGGWKNHAEKSIAKLDFYREAEGLLGIPDARLRDGYGSVEHCIPYVECRNHHFHVPTWSRVIIRDVRTLLPMPEGQIGFLNVISPYATCAPIHSVLMGDLARISSECDCGIPTPWFEIIGRAGTSKNKSCSVAASELLNRFQRGS